MADDSLAEQVKAVKLNGTTDNRCDISQSEWLTSEELYQLALRFYKGNAKLLNYKLVSKFILTIFAFILQKRMVQKL